MTYVTIFTGIIGSGITGNYITFTKNIIILPMTSKKNEQLILRFISYLSILP